MPKRVRILYIGCPSLDTDALSQLLLSQNLVQKEIEFSIFNHWLYSQTVGGPPAGLLGVFGRRLSGPRNAFTAWLARRYRAALDTRAFPEFRKRIDRKTWRAICQEKFKAYDDWLRARPSVPVDCAGMATIIITQAPITDGFFSLSDSGLGLISTAYWSDYFKPVRPFDYLLAAVQRLALRLACSGQLSAHYETKGCLWDYCQHQPDARVAILNGHICEECGAKLSHAIGDEGAETLRRLVSNAWVGQSGNELSPAGVLSRIYMHDLSRSMSFNSRLFSRMRDVMPAEIGKMVVDGLRWSLVIAMALLVASCFPQALRSVKEQLAELEPTRTEKNLVPLVKPSPERMPAAEGAAVHGKRNKTKRTSNVGAVKKKSQ
jgi:hypothetical protein